MKRQIIVLAAVALMGTSAPAQESLTQAAAVRATLANNRDLAAARVRVQEAKARLQQAGLWPNPELELGGRFDNGGEYNFAVGINQPFSVSGRIAGQKGVARVEVEYTLAKVADQERQLVGDVRRAFAELFATDEQIRLQKFLISLNEELLAATRTAQKQGQVSEKDVNAILIALQQARQRRQVLETQRRKWLLELNKVMGQPADHEFVASGALEFEAIADLSAFSLENALAHRPDFAAAQLDVSLARAGYRLAKAERFDDWLIGVGYERELSVIDGAPPQSVNQFIGFKLTVPLPIFDRKQGRIRETVAREERALKEMDALKLRISQELADALQRVRTLAPLLESYSPEILGRAEDNVKLVENGYRQGLTSIVEVIQSRQQFAELKSSYSDTLRDYQLAVTDLEVAAGAFPVKPTEVKKP